MALVVLSKVEQRLDAVRAVLAGASVVEVAAAFRVSRSSERSRLPTACRPANGGERPSGVHHVGRNQDARG